MPEQVADAPSPRSPALTLEYKPREIVDDRMEEVRDRSSQETYAPVIPSITSERRLKRTSTAYRPSETRRRLEIPRKFLPLKTRRSGNRHTCRSIRLSRSRILLQSRRARPSRPQKLEELRSDVEKYRKNYIERHPDASQEDLSEVHELKPMMIAAREQEYAQELNDMREHQQLQAETLEQDLYR